MPAWLIPFLIPFVQQAAPYIVTGLGIAATYLVHRFVKNQKIKDAYDWLRQHVGPVVAAVEQTYVDSIVANGSTTLTADQKAQAFKLALKAILDQIPPEYLALLRKAFPGDGQLEAVIETLIESEVKKLELARKGATTANISLPVIGMMAQPAAPAPATPEALENPKANPPR